MKKLAVLSVIAAAILLLTQAASFAFAAPPTNEQDKGPPTLEKMVFIHYRADFAPGKPGWLPVKPEKIKTPELYSYSKFHWLYSTATEGIEWYYNPNNSPGQTDYTQAMKDSFLEWDSVEEANIKFIYKTTTSLEPSWDQFAAPDGCNVVGWDDLNPLYPEAIGITVVWYYRYLKGEKIIYECDTVLNSNEGYAWTWGDVDPDEANDTLIPATDDYDVDVQNIMTHEAGHWLMLDDMYDTDSSEQTMHGIAYDRELKKISLEEGDIAGIKAIY